MSGRRKHKIHPDYFNFLDNSKKVYLLGYLWADAHLSKNGLVVNCHHRDMAILKELKKVVGGTIYRYTRIDPKRKIPKYRTTTYMAHSRKLVRNMSLTFRKTTNHIPKNYYKYFIRGFLDGDGCVYHNSKHYLFQVSFNGPDNEWQWLLDMCPKEFEFTNPRLGEIRICGKNAKKFLKWVYNGNSKLGLKRKKDIYVKNRN